MQPVANVTLHMTSMCRIVITSSSLHMLRSGMSNVSTIPNPEKIAPATKYGGKIVVCQPGTCDTAKSSDTME